MSLLLLVCLGCTFLLHSFVCARKFSLSLLPVLQRYVATDLGVQQQVESRLPLAASSIIDPHLTFYRKTYNNRRFYVTFLPSFKHIPFGASNQIFIPFSCKASSLACQNTTPFQHLIESFDCRALLLFGTQSTSSCTYKTEIRTADYCLRGMWMWMWRAISSDSHNQQPTFW